MNASLETALAQMGELRPPEQERLAELLLDLVAHVKNSTGDPLNDFTPDELAELKVMSKEPFVAADPAKVDTFFARHGL